MKINKKIFLRHLGYGVLGTVLVMGLNVVIGIVGLRVLTSSSVPGYVYLNAQQEVTKGAFVAFCPPLKSEAIRTLAARDSLTSGSCGITQGFIKPVVAVQGDVVSVTPASILVNGVAIPSTAVKETDRSGLPFPHMPYGDYAVKRGEAWVISNYHERSLDSRYYGPLPVRSLTPVKRIL